MMRDHVRPGLKALTDQTSIYDSSLIRSGCRESVSFASDHRSRTM